MKKKTIFMTVLGAAMGISILASGVGIYRCYCIRDDIYYPGKGIQLESHKEFANAWIEKNDDEYPDMGFVLRPDSTAYSINSASLIYKKWKIKNDNLVLTAIGLGNHQLTVNDEVYPIISFNSHRLYLKYCGKVVIYDQVDAPEDQTKLPNITFDYCSVLINTAAVSKAAIDWNSNPRAEKFRTVLSEAYAKPAANFAGYYQVVAWGCGSGVQEEGVMIDTRDGKVYDLPTLKGYMDIGSGCEHQKESFLMITFQNINKPDNQGVEKEEHLWLWNESGKEFVSYK